MTLLTRLATSAIRESPLVPLCHGSIFLTMTLSLSNGSKGEVAQQEKFSLFEKEGSAEILISAEKP